MEPFSLSFAFYLFFFQEAAKKRAANGDYKGDSENAE